MESPDDKAVSPSATPAGDTSERRMDCSQTAIPSQRPTVPSACIGCRSKHLKCNGSNPCARCIAQGIECTYVRSRRGYRGPRRANKNPVTPPIPAGVAWPPVGHASTVASSDTSESTSGSNDNFARETTLTNFQQSLEQAEAIRALANGCTEPIDPALQPGSTINLRERCFEAFYHFFYAAHPFVLPRLQLFRLAKTRQIDRQLEAAIHYIGSFYVPQENTAALAQEAENALSKSYGARNGYTVQAMLLLAIGLDGSADQKKAAQVLHEAQDIALELGMHQREFSILHGEGSAVLEESWRRTWWELYVVDGMIAGVHQRTSFRLNGINASVPLPCEENEYIQGNIPPSRSIEELDDAAFADEEIVFSSYAYRLTAIRNLGKVLELQQLAFVDGTSVDKIDSHLVSWNLHLPASKQLFSKCDGQVDEMLFQAHMVTNASSILLHKQHSHLDTSVAKTVNSCAPQRASPVGKTQNTHAAKVITAADNITKLITLPTQLEKHTHFFVCCTTIASIVHLSCWSSLVGPSLEDEDLKQRIRLNTGALKTLSAVWPSAETTLCQVRGVAQDIFRAKKMAAELGFWNNFTEEEMMRSMIDDESMINGFQLV